MQGKTIDHKFMKEEFDENKVQVFESMRKHILSKPILQRANIDKRFCLKTDFLSKGLGFALCQPDDSPESLAAMKREDEGGPCEFEVVRSNKRLLPVAFGYRKTIGNEEHLHSHPGECLASSWGTEKNRHFLWGRTFSLITDCEALIWLMAYKGFNHAIHRLKMMMLGFWFTITHRLGPMLEDANYFSRLGADIHIDPLLQDYLSFVRQSYIRYPPSSEPLSHDNMPGRRSKRPKPTIEDGGAPSVNFAHVEWLEDPACINITPPTNKLARQYANIPVDIISTSQVQQSSNKHWSYITKAAVNLSVSNWCLSQPGHGHFIEASRAININFHPTIVCNTNQSCRSTMQTRYESAFIFESTTQMAEFCSNGNLPFVQGYYANCRVSEYNNNNVQDLKVHEKVISALLSRANLQIFVVELPLNLLEKPYREFKLRLQQRG
jgi:hypothetical protein